MKKITKLSFILICCLITVLSTAGFAQAQTGKMAYTVSFPEPASNGLHVKLQTSGWQQDTLNFKMPKWMPGYYQIMDYADEIVSISAEDSKGEKLTLDKINENTWQITGVKNKAFTLNYDIKTSKQFVANSYVDAEHAYLINASTFFYVDGFINIPVAVKVEMNEAWSKIATGLTLVKGKTNEFTAPDFDILYDCPILIGNMEELPSFEVGGKLHRFVGYKLGDFDHEGFMQKLKLMVESAVAIIGDIPYKEYTFIGIGPGRGGIEHLNNTTVSFDGNRLNSDAAMNGVLNFLAHEYFHHYNVKRIRPFELGPFDYDQGSKTNLLWVSEGLSVYYEYLVIKRAGLASVETLFEDFENNINVVENNPGKKYQSLVQSSYNTWKDGPFGTQGEEKGKTISYYQKGPVVGLLLDFAIRNATKNEKSLDDVMQYVYYRYYKELGRGFTDAEFEQTCETVAGAPLTEIFEYIYTTKPLDYDKYLGMAGLKLEANPAESDPEKKVYKLKQIENPTELQKEIFQSWIGE
ncbi:M61 family peptidase [Chondrinema litorale]|uniref:M61 family metallopeptidase n=1 Tax=Chondrinema litorale TaxID=2994555 RepID=UPI0025431C72|nr:M61 family peptidase [Chondrinema litorale]UZR99473.1 M61 family peptidase [Chondrinema litorale]